MSMKILITGAGGFIGGFIVEEALSRGYETWAGVRKTTSREHLSDPVIRFIDFNYGNKKILTDQLLSHKGEYGAWDYIVYNLGVTKCKNPDDFDRINYGFVKNFTEALVETEMVPKQFIMTSSLGAWGVGDEKNFTPIRPTDTPHPNTRYGKSKLKAEKLLGTIDTYSAVEHNVITRIVPLVVKDFFLRIAYRMSGRAVTATFSNIGIVKMPENMNKFIKCFDVYISTDKLQLCSCSFDGKLTLGFTSQFISSDIEMRFFRELTSRGIDVELTSNIHDDERND